MCERRPTAFAALGMTRGGAVAWILTLQFYVVSTFAGLQWRGYNFIADRISDLGAVRSPMHGLVNASMVLQGFLIAGGAVLMRAAFPASRLRMLGLAFVALNGAGVLLVGVVPEDTNRFVHDIGALALFLTGNLAMIVLGASLLHDGSRLRVLGAAGVALGCAGGVAAVLFAVRSVSGHAIGLFEHVAVDPMPIWLMMSGLFYLWRRADFPVARS